MTQNENELEAMQRFVKADHRFRLVLYAVVIFCALVFGGVAYELTRIENAQREESMRRDKEGAEILQNALNTIEMYTRNVVEQNKIQNEESKRFFTCLLQTPIEFRTDELLEGCRKKSDLPGGAEPNDFRQSQSSGQGSEVVVGVVPSSLPQNTPNPPTQQPDISQPDEPDPDTEPEPNSPTLTQRINTQIIQPIVNGVRELPSHLNNLLRGGN